MDGRTDGRARGLTGGLTDGRGRTDGRTDARTFGRTDGYRILGCTLGRITPFQMFIIHTHYGLEIFFPDIQFWTHIELYTHLSPEFIIVSMHMPIIRQSSSIRNLRDQNIFTIPFENIIKGYLYIQIESTDWTDSFLNIWIGAKRSVSSANISPTCTSTQSHQSHSCPKWKCLGSMATYWLSSDDWLWGQTHSSFCRLWLILS